MSNRITENLSAKALSFTYPGDELKKAIEDGRFAAEIQKCADELYAGDFNAACAAVARTWQSQICNIKKAINTYGAMGTQGAMRLAARERAEMVLAFVSGKRAAAKNARAAGDGKPGWMHTVEDIEAIPLEDLDRLTKVRDLMASKLSVYPEKIEETVGMEAFQAAYKAVRERRSKAAALAKKGTGTAEVSDALKLIETLKKGGKLNKADKALLAQALELLTK